MKTLGLTIAALGCALAAFVVADTTPAMARDYPWCLAGRDSAGFGQCDYDTYEQCRAAALGRGASCDYNRLLRYQELQQSTEPAPRRRGSARR